MPNLQNRIAALFCFATILNRNQIATKIEGASKIAPESTAKSQRAQPADQPETRKSPNVLSSALRNQGALRSAPEISAARGLYNEKSTLGSTLGSPPESTPISERTAESTLGSTFGDFFLLASMAG